uniref:3-beta hydroxysteroid dehydrogenase/isomerase domain-containing protein n=1 Tax=Acrobeloides nanus TaxID=290746 RepID=A0A914C7Z5_9BILA
MDSQRFCILGGGGYLGQHLAKALQENGHFVVILDLSFPSFPYIPLDPTKVRRIKGSIMERDRLDEALKGCDACFHIAGYGMSGGPSLNRRMTMMINVEGTERVLQSCQKNGVHRLIYTSSISVVFSDQEVYDIDESTPYLSKFLTPYAESKCIAEKIVLQANIPGQFHSCALRFRGIYGPGEMRTTQRTVDLFMKGLIKMRFEKNDPCLTQYSSVENSVMALQLAEKSLRLNNATAAGKAYNIVDGGPPVEAIKFWFPLMEYFGVTPPKVHIPYILIYILLCFFVWY